MTGNENCLFENCCVIELAFVLSHLQSLEKNTGMHTVKQIGSFKISPHLLPHISRTS